MSMISEQVADLREKAQVFEDSGCATNGIVKTFRKAADTIEELSAKLATANIERSTAYYNDGWIPCSERLPKESKAYEVTIINSNNERFTMPLYYSEEYKTWATRNNVIAWRERLEPYKGVE